MAWGTLRRFCTNAATRRKILISTQVDLPKEGKGGGIMNLFKSTKPASSSPRPPAPQKRSSGGIGKFLGKAQAPPPPARKKKPAAKGMEAFLGGGPQKKARRAPAEVIDVDAPLVHRPANDVVIDVDAEPWTCSKCTYHHAEAEAGFLACAMCGAQKE